MSFDEHAGEKRAQELISEFQNLEANWTDHVRMSRTRALIDVTVRSRDVGYIYAAEGEYKMRKSGDLTEGPDYSGLADVWRALRLRVERELEREAEQFEKFKREQAPYLREVSGLTAWSE